MSNSTAPITSTGDTSKTSATTSLPTTESSTPPTTQVATTSTATAPTSPPPSTQLFTSTITASSDGSSQSLQTVVITQGSTLAQTTNPSNTGTSSSTSSTNAAVSVGQKQSSGGLSAGGKTAIAVVIPVVVVALLIIACLFLWRRRNQRQSEKEERKKEMEEYGYNPNNDPTLPAVAATDEIVEDQSGYRGWGTTSSSNRQASTTVSGGMAHPSDGGYHSPGSPTQGASVSDHNSGDPLMNQRRETMDSEIIGNLAATPAAAAGQSNTGVRRGPSNASSAYSAGDRSATSGEARAAGPNGQQDYYTDNAYYQPGPYENPYGSGQQPVIRDNPARRNTRIERPDVFPHQGTSGIAQNF